MLEELQVRDLALIDTLDLSFKKGLTVLTGETGAGKTIIIDALDLVLGKRADTSRVRSGAGQAIVKALFSVDRSGKDADDERGDSYDLLLERRVSSEGKSRSYVDGSLVTRSDLLKTGSGLIDIHGQHDHQSLFRTDVHLELLDRFAGYDISELKARFKEKLALKVANDKSLAELLKNEDEIDSNRADLSRQLGEIDSLNIDIEVDEAAEDELKRLKNFEDVREAISSSLLKLSSDDKGGYDLIQQASTDLVRGQAFFSALKKSVEVLESVTASLEDVMSELRHFEEENDFDPERLRYLEDRVYELGILKRKHGGTLKAVIVKRESLGAELKKFDSSNREIIELKDEIEKDVSDLLALGRKLSSGREKSARLLESKVKEVLVELGLVGADFRVDIKTSEDDIGNWRAGGFDQAEYMIAANKGERLRPIVKVASGGEISRIMLALKSVLSSEDSVETLIFDEIDTGIGGKTAALIGKKLSALAESHQVICVTHLPQIAVYADAQYNVEKKEISDRTITSVRELNDEERLAELSRMSGSDGDSAVAVEHARELIKVARSDKASSVSSRV